MAVPYIMPLGFIDRPTETGATFNLTNPEDSLGRRPGTPVTVWRYSPELLAVAKLRGTVSDVGYTTATFTTIETQTAPGGPTTFPSSGQPPRSSWPWQTPSSQTRNAS